MNAPVRALCGHPDHYIFQVAARQPGDAAMLLRLILNSEFAIGTGHRREARVAPTSNKALDCVTGTPSAAPFYPFDIRIIFCIALAPRAPTFPDDK